VRHEAYTARFVDMLLTLVRGNISLADALRIMSREGIEPAIRESAEELLAITRKGRSLSAGMGMLCAGKVRFSPLYLTLIRAAELTGSIEGVLADIRADLQRKQAARERVTTVMIYPVFIIAVALVGTVIIIVKGIPVFTQAGFLSGPVLENAVAGVIVAGIFLLASGTLLLLAYYRIFNNDSAEYRMFRLLAFLLRNSIDLPQALSQSIAAMAGGKQEKALIGIKKDIAAGVRVSRAFSQSGLVSPYITGWLAVADESGDLAGACGTIAGFFQERDSLKRERAAKFVEPAAIVITGSYLLMLILTVIVPILTHAGGLL
jgi:type II secretory pathway component PulF